ncbi:MAG: hypothetical protein ABI904_06010 [Chloroflexota bacterium]
MRSNKLWLVPLVLILVVILVLASLYSLGQPAPKETELNSILSTLTSPTVSVSEQPITLISLGGPIAESSAELSGLAWIGDTLVLLSQYPERFGADEGVLFAIPKQTILDYLDGKSKEPIVPHTIKLKAPGLKDGIKNYEGFEAIGFFDQRVYLTIESGKNDKMMGYLVSGTLSADLTEIDIDTEHIVEIQPPVQMDNRTDESLVITQNKILTFFEINGADLNPKPGAHVFSLDLKPEGTIPFPSLEYRVTDAALGADGAIWVINKVAPKEIELFPKSDPLFEKYHIGSAPGQFPVTERLVKLNYDPTGITLADTPPVQINFDKLEHNWEGLELLDKRGFLLVTDKNPSTLLVFIPMP